MRCAARDTVLPKGGGEDGQSSLFVAKGTPCRYSSYSLHRRKDVFGPDAEEFRPERWETLRTTYGQPLPTMVVVLTDNGADMNTFLLAADPERASGNNLP